MTNDAPQTWNPRTIIGTVLCRVVVPLWILAGVTAKLVESSPRLLPKKMLDDASALGVDLNVLLGVIISLEILAVLVIALLGRVSRVAAGFMLTAFCLVLIREIIAKSPSCGCMGSISPPPWVMLGIDGAMLAGVIAFKPYRFGRMDNRFWPPIAVAAMFIIGSALAFWRVVPMSDSTPPPPPPPHDVATSNGDSAAPVTPVATPSVKLPDYYYVSDIETWPGKRWSEIPLLTYLDTPPAGLDTGTHYVVFYSRTCEHCEIPAKKDKLQGEGIWTMPASECAHKQLPLGCDWIISPPLTLEIVDGIVKCAKEGDHKECMGIE